MRLFLSPLLFFSPVPCAVLLSATATLAHQLWYHWGTRLCGKVRPLNLCGTMVPGRTSATTLPQDLLEAEELLKDLLDRSGDVARLQDLLGSYCTTKCV